LLPKASASLGGLWCDWKPPPPLTVSEWADSYRYLSSESSAEPGRWRTSKAPYQRGLMDAIRDPAISEVVCMKAAQIGWTEILNNCIGYYVHQEPSPILLLQPTVEMAEAWSKDRFAPMVRDTPVLRELVADPKSRDSGNTILHKRFQGGHLTVVGANSPAGLASRPIRIVLCDDIDRFPVSAGSEGDPIDLARKRTATFRNRRVLLGSTPTIKGSSRIEAAFAQSDQRFFFVPCPHCEEFQRLVWAQVRWPDGEPERCAYVCKHCGGLIEERQKLWMFLRGEWRTTAPSKGIAGFHLSGLYSLWQPWRQVVADFLRAKQFPETLRVWVNTSLGESWEDEGETLEPAGLLARRESYTAESLPAGVLLITQGTDVQTDRIESTVWGWGHEEECWRVAHHVLRGDPGGAALWAEHDELLKRKYRTDDGRTLIVEACAVDSGGQHTQHVYDYCSKRRRFRVWAVKGTAGFGKLAWPKKVSRAGRMAVSLFLIGVDTIKDVIYGRLKRITEPGPGYVHLDATADEGAVDQLTAETIVDKFVHGRRERRFKLRSAGARNEQLDTFVYAYAAMIGRGGAALLARRQTFHVEQKPTLERAPEPEHEPEPELPPAEAFRRPRSQAPARRPSNWVMRWR
jgi:phage terminase large subunit GpA-like protein